MPPKFILPTKIWHPLGKVWLELESSLKIGQDLKANSKLSLQDFKLTQLKFEALADVFNARLSHRFNVFSDFLKEEVDFLPFDFFKRGTDCGDAVCCLFYQFSDDEEITEFLNLVGGSESLQAFLQKWIKVDPTKVPREDVIAALKKTQIPCATGFLVGAAGSYYILTNKHVVPTRENLKGFTAVFRYNGSYWNQSIENSDWLKYEFDTDFHKPTDNEELDYVLLRLKDKSISNLIKKPIAISNNRSTGVIPTITPVDVQDLITLMGNNLTPANREDLRHNGLQGDAINIIQHPEGRSKQVVICNNRLMAIYPDCLEYKTDTEPGSSGSPLFNNDWELVGMHKGMIIEPIEDAPDQRPKITFLGIRLTSIVEDLRNQAEQKGDSELQEFIKVHIDALPNAPLNQNKRVFILAGDHRRDILGEINAEIESSAMKNLRTQIIHAVDDRITTIEVNGPSLQKAINKINQQFDPKSQDIAIQLLVDDDDGRSATNGLGIYYYGGNPKRKSQAKNLVESVKKIAPDTPIFGSFSDDVSSTGGLYFCDRVEIPSFVIYLGFLSNENDLSRITGIQNQPTSPQPIAKAIAEWLQEFT